MKKRSGIILAALLASACANQTDGAVQRVNPQAAAGEIPAGVSQISPETATLVDGNTAFAVDLYKELNSKQDGNIFVSPASISTAFGLAYAGAVGETQEEIARVLHFDALAPDVFHPAMGALMSGLEINIGDEDNEEVPGARLSINNALWVDKLTVLEEPYAAQMAEHYGAGDYRVDYRRNPDGARKTINRWVEEKTEDRIKNLLAKPNVTDETRSILINTIYMNADWRVPFTMAATTDEDFRRLDGRKIETSMMRNVGHYRHWQDRKLQILEMPYHGDLSMVVLLPKKKDGLPALEKSLSAQSVNKSLSNLEQAKQVEVDLKFPKLKLRTRYPMVSEKILPNLGMTRALSNAADFSAAVRAERQPDGYPLKIGEVVHQTFLEVDEKGTEAAAATAIASVAITSARVGPPPPPPIPFFADHPFLFLIKDNKTGMILFMGRIMEPAQ